MDAFAIYSEWFEHHYGRPFACTREQWSAWCRQPSRKSSDDFDVETELREGWACDQQFEVAHEAA